MRDILKSCDTGQGSPSNNQQAQNAPESASSPVWEQARLSIAALAMKRSLDFVASAVALAVALPLMVALGIAIKLDSPGPVFFVQTRVGARGSKFRLFKFRSMYRNAEEIRESLMHLNEASGPVFKITHDPRITRVGKFLRKLSFDEVPQLINVLKGEMSLVGPRPPLPCEVEKYTPHEWKRLSVKPGMTCLWQIGGRSDIPFDRWVELDLQYIRQQSLIGDIKILLLTVPAVLFGRGAR